MSITFCLTNYYDQKPPLRPPAKQTQFKPNLKNAKINLSSVKTKEYANESRLRPPPKQTQSNPIKPPFLTTSLRRLHIIPATISAIIFSRLAVQLLIIWAAAIIASITGLLFAYYLDFSIGPAIALFLGGELILVAIITRFLSNIGLLENE